MVSLTCCCRSFEILNSIGDTGRVCSLDSSHVSNPLESLARHCNTRKRHSLMIYYRHFSCILCSQVVSSDKVCFFPATGRTGTVEAVADLLNLWNEYVELQNPWHSPSVLFFVFVKCSLISTASSESLPVRDKVPPAHLGVVNFVLLH